MQSVPRKRKAVTDLPDSTRKKSNGRRQWRVLKHGSSHDFSTVESGEAGIWVTCNRGQEARCTAEIRDVLNHYTENLREAASTSHEQSSNVDDPAEGDIEADIRNEVEDLRRPTQKPLFQLVKTDITCVLFFKVRPPVEPTALVHQICSDARQNPQSRRSRYVQRLTPVTMMDKATEKGLDRVAKAVLAPHFHLENNPARKFAIRTTIRNHTELTRDIIIKQVADAVGSEHSVDLSQPEKVILVEVYKNMCGMAVVDGEYNDLKRYNLAEIYDPTPVKRNEEDAVPSSVAS